MQQTWWDSSAVAGGGSSSGSNSTAGSGSTQRADDAPALEVLGGSSGENQRLGTVVPAALPALPPPVCGALKSDLKSAAALPAIAALQPGAAARQQLAESWQVLQAHLRRRYRVNGMKACRAGPLRQCSTSSSGSSSSSNRMGSRCWSIRTWVFQELAQLIPLLQQELQSAL